jgi:NAD(P)-dependent dehydrogenase (short-subunit alcohol dehydrogenase family)
MGKDLNKKTAVVIGATGNLGNEVCKALTEKGYSIDPVWNSPKHPDATKSESFSSLPKK